MSPLEIKVLRKRFGMTLDTFAYLLGCNRQTIYFWEYGKNRPSKVFMERLQVLKNLLETPFECTSCGMEKTSKIVRFEDVWVVMCSVCNQKITEIRIPQDPIIELINKGVDSSHIDKNSSTE